MKKDVYLLLLVLLIPVDKFLAQALIPEVLQCALESSHWKEFYCLDENEKELIAGIETQNKVPLYPDVHVNEDKIPMITYGSEHERYWVQIRKIRIEPSFASIKLLYDSRVKAHIRLGKEEGGKWFVLSSTFKQKYGCGGSSIKKSFIWNF